MKALIISLNFHPGHFSHLIANYKLLQDCGFTPYLYINKSFNIMDEKNEFNKINHPSELNNLQKIDLAVFWFPSLKNILETFRLKFLFGAKIIYVYHEPFDTLQNYYQSGFRFKKIAKICLIHLVNLPTILLSHQIILPSLSSFKLYQEKYTHLNKNYTLMPLLFGDEAISSHNNKKYISYIGTVAADHAFDRFVEFVHVSLQNAWFPETVFLIAISSNMPAKERKILEPYLLLQSKNLVIIEGQRMTNAEINQHYQDSLIVWNAYNRSMQSGVLPKAYMFGAAVILLTRNANEFIVNHETGVLISDNKNTSEIREAIEEILSQKDFFFQNCRAKFFEQFYYKNKIEDYLSLLDNGPTAKLNK